MFLGVRHVAEAINRSTGKLQGLHGNARGCGGRARAVRRCGGADPG